MIRVMDMLESFTNGIKPKNAGLMLAKHDKKIVQAICFKLKGHNTYANIKYFTQNLLS